MKEDVIYTKLLKGKIGDSQRKNNNNNNNNNIVLLRNDISEFTPAELEALAQLEINDNDDEISTDNNNNNNNNNIKNNFNYNINNEGNIKLRQLLPREYSIGSSDSIADAILNTKQLDVSDHHLYHTTLIECFLNLTHLYLQHNNIILLDGLSLLTQLQVFVFHHNRVETLRPLANLNYLHFIDARFNNIKNINPIEDLPVNSLQYISLLANPCCGATAQSKEERDLYRNNIINCCVKLEILDDISCNNSEISSFNSDNDDEEKEEINNNNNNNINKNSITRLRLHQSLEMSKPKFAKNNTSSLNLSEIKTNEMKTTKTKQFINSEIINVSDRLFEQFQHRSNSIRRIAEHHTSEFTTLEENEIPITLSSTNINNNNNINININNILPEELTHEREMKSRLFNDIQFAINTNKEKAQQEVINVWENVEKVMKTKQQLIQERRKRIEARRGKVSNAYKESLALLQEESKEKDLNKYRNIKEEVERK